MVSGQAALRIIRQEYSKATELYTSVLALAEKYNEIIRYSQIYFNLYLGFGE